MDDEYIIVNKTAIQKRIEELERQIKESSIEETGEYDFQCEDKIEELNWVLSQSTPLIPEIEKAYENGFGYYSELLWDIEKGYGDKRTVKGLNEQDYISNLKLDI